MVGNTNLIELRVLKIVLIFMLLFFGMTPLYNGWLQKTYLKTKEVLSHHTEDLIKYMTGKGRYNQYLLNFHIRYIEQAAIKKYIPWLTVKRILLILAMNSGILFLMAYYKSRSVALGISLACIASMAPLVVFEILRQYNFQHTRENIVHLLSLLGQWYVVTEDMMKCFEKVSEHQLSEPLSTYINDFVVQVHCGLEISQALDILNRKVESEFFSTFIVNIDQAMHNRGDVGIMLRNLEDEAYKLQEEFNRRKISTAHDKVVIFATMLSVLVIGYQFLILNEVTEYFYFHTFWGRTLVVCFSILYLAGFIIAVGLSKLEY